jgi:hypothetical protein
MKRIFQKIVVVASFQLGVNTIGIPDIISFHAAKYKTQPEQFNIRTYGHI